MTTPKIAAPLTLVLFLTLQAACGSSGRNRGTPTPTLPPATAAPSPTPTAAVPSTVPDFSAATFTDPTQIDNVYFPLVPGTTRTYLGETEDGAETVIVEVLDEVREVLGVTTRVVRDRVFLDGLLIEDTYDWYAQDDGRNVWYMGEEVDDYNYDDQGNLIDITHGGIWEAGKDVVGVGSIAWPGHLMKAAPLPGDIYHQEYYRGEAEDMAEVLALDVPVTTSDGTMYSCLQTRDFTPLEPDVNEHKFYASGIGAVLEEKVGEDERLELKGIFLTGPETIPDPDSATFSNPTQIDNAYFPLVPGTTYTYEAETEDGLETIIVEVLEEVRLVIGIETVVVRDRVFLDDVLIEDTYDWYAQDDDGNIWYMGEEVDNYNYDDAGNLIDITHEGAWEAGEDVAGVGNIAVPGIIMKAQPRPGESYRQEYYQGDAEDMAFVVRLDAFVEVDGETFCESCLQILDWNPLDAGTLEYKFYDAGVGTVLEAPLGSDEIVQLIQVEPPG